MGERDADGALRRLTDGLFRWSGTVGTPGEWTGTGHGHLHVRDGEAVLFDPPEMTDGDLTRLERLGAPAAVLLTSDWHGRAAPLFAERYDVPVYATAAAAPHCDCDVDETFGDGAALPGDWRAVAVPLEGESKFHGVACFYHDAAGGVLVSGDACLARGDGTVVARDAGHLDGLERLLEYDFDVLLAGHGPAVLESARDRLARALDEERTLS